MSLSFNQSWPFTDVYLSKIYQAWGAGRSIVSGKDKKDVCVDFVYFWLEILTIF